MSHKLPEGEFFTPIGARVLMRLLQPKDLPSGIVMPQHLKNKDPRENVSALVLAVGAECKTVKAGDIVIGHDSTPIATVMLRGVEVVVSLCDECNLLGVVRGEIKNLYGSPEDLDPRKVNGNGD